MKSATYISLLTLIFFLILGNFSLAQFDDRFYFPTKEIIGLKNVTFDSYFFKTESDSIAYKIFDTKEKAIATCFYFHGAGGNYSNYVNFITPLVEQNIQVIAIDFRGYGESTGTPTHLNIKEDGQKWFKFMLKNHDITSKIMVYGASMGTQIATHLASVYQSNIDVLILDGTISSFTDIAIYSAPEFQKKIIEQYVTSPYSAKEDIKLIKPNEVKILFIHSKEDVEVPIYQAEEVYNNSPETKLFWVYSGGHLEAPILHKDEFVSKILLLLQD